MPRVLCTEDESSLRIVFAEANSTSRKTTRLLSANAPLLCIVDMHDRIVLLKCCLVSDL